MATRSVNKVLLIGHVTRDAETKFTPSGAAVTRFAVATNRSYKQGDEWKEEVNYTNVTAWQQEKLSNFLTKGKQVYVEGRLQTRSYDDKDGKKVYATDVIADQIILLGSGGQGESSGEPRSQRAAAPAGRANSPQREDEYSGLGITDDDVPF